MKRCIFLSWFLAILIFSFGCGGTDTLAQKKLTIATGSRSGVYYPVGEAIARILTQAFKDVQVQVLETEGTVQNLSLLKEGKANLALAQNDLAHYAVQGENMFAQKKIPGLAGIGTLYSEVVHILSRREDKISNLSELKGKKVCVGSENTGTFFNAQQLLSLANVWNDVNREDIPFAESLVAIENKEIDVLFFTTGMPNPGIAELAEKLELSLVPLESKFVQELVNSHPFYYPTEIPANTYKGITSPVPAIEINALFITNSTLSENDQYLITRTLFSSLETLKQSHPKLSGITKNSIRRQMTIPLAPGTAREFKESK